MTSQKPFLIVGAGFSGAVLARELAAHTNKRVVVIDSRNHLGGNCHTQRDETTGIMLHAYGPHIFNTDNEEVWAYVNRFGKFRPFINRVRAKTARGIFPLPINLQTINQFFGKTMNPAEAVDFMANIRMKNVEQPANFEEAALGLVGRELYETFFYGYTRKQWGCDPREIDASVMTRIPVRFNYDDNYYNSLFQGIPENGYTALVEGILDLPSIAVELSVKFETSMAVDFEHVFYTGPIDAYFNHVAGRLGYRNVSFERIDALGDLQGNAVINYTELEVPHTRVHEHKHFTPWEKHDRTVAFREYSREAGDGDAPYYPTRKQGDRGLLRQYYDLARGESGVSFLGRLGTYRYLDMDDVIWEALNFSRQWLRCFTTKSASMPQFSHDPFVRNEENG